jgi:peroxiredoxin
MKKLLTLAFISIGFFANAQTVTLKPGQTAPDFSLKSTEGKKVSFSDYPDAKGYIVVFTCNDCPYAKAYESRIMDLDKKFSSAGYPVIAINPNDPDVVPGEAFDEMKALAKSKHYSFPYLFDAGQTVTDQYGAKATPHTFVIQKTKEGNIIKYTGAIDNDTEDENPAKIKYVEQVIASLMKNEAPAYTVTRAIGCTVKRKSR